MTCNYLLKLLSNKVPFDSGVSVKREAGLSWSVDPFCGLKVLSQRAEYRDVMAELYE